jgi:hypothetical protein
LLFSSVPLPSQSLCLLILLNSSFYLFPLSIYSISSLYSSIISFYSSHCTQLLILLIFDSFPYYTHLIILLISSSPPVYCLFIPECSSVLNVMVTKCNNAENGNITGCKGTKCLSYKMSEVTKPPYSQNVQSQKTSIAAKRP